HFNSFVSRLGRDGRITVLSGLVGPCRYIHVFTFSWANLSKALYSTSPVNIPALLLFLAAAASAGTQTLRYEAEDGVLSGTIVDDRIPGYSGSGYVTAFDEPDDYVE